MEKDRAPEVIPLPVGDIDRMWAASRRHGGLVLGDPRDTWAIAYYSWLGSSSNAADSGMGIRG